MNPAEEEEEGEEEMENKIGRIIAVMSGKGGVGKSSVTALTAVALKNQGYRTGIMDGDITGPSIGKLFGIDGKATGEDGRINPAVTSGGIKVVTMNMFLPSEDEPVIWRGPLLAGVIKQFWEEVDWGELDYLVVDLPPGTGDVPLTVFQTLPVDDILIVTAPQSLSNMVVRKAVGMAEKMDVRIAGIIENMSYYVCPGCGRKEYIFGTGKSSETLEKTGLKLLAELPLDPNLSKMCDEGRVEQYGGENLKILEEIIDGVVNGES